MFHRHALRSAGMLMLCSALCEIPCLAKAQTGDRILPPVTIEAPRALRARLAVEKPRVRSSSSARRQTRPPAATITTVAAQNKNVTASAARESLIQAPTGQTETTIDRSRFDNRPAFSVGDILSDSPGVSVKQGNGPRDIGISIRGSNARNTFGIRNVVIFDDGFPVTQPDGLSRSDLIDPRAYGAIENMASMAGASVISTIIWRPAKSSATSRRRCLPATRGATDSSATAGSTRRRSIFLRPCRQPPMTALP
jgi:iron complex outermembrane receptor protein